MTKATVFGSPNECDRCVCHFQKCQQIIHIDPIGGGLLVNHLKFWKVSHFASLTVTSTGLFFPESIKRRHANGFTWIGVVVLPSGDFQLWSPFGDDVTLPQDSQKLSRGISTSSNLCCVRFITWAHTLKIDISVKQKKTIFLWQSHAYYFESGVQPTRTIYSSHGNENVNGYWRSLTQMSVMCNVSDSVNCTNFNFDLAFGVPARGKRYSSKSPPTDCDEGNVNKQTSLSSTSSYTIR